MANILNKRDKLIILISILCMILVLVVGYSYAYWMISKVQTGQNNLIAGCFDFEFSGENDINLEDAYPMTDAEGLTTVPYSFTVKNICDTAGRFQINLETMPQEESVKVLPAKYLKAGISTFGVFKEANVLTDNLKVEPILDDALEAFDITNGYIKPKETKTFDFRLWVDYDAPTEEEMMDATYKGKITIDLDFVSDITTLKKRSSAYSNDDYYAYRTNITKVVLEDNLHPIDTELSWDVSSDNSGLVMSYLVPNEEDSTTYILYIQQDGGVLAPEDSSHLFFGFSNLKSIDGVGLDTSYTTNMYGLFQSCYSLENIDLSTFNTSNVTNMSGMFSGCETLTSIDVSGFDTSKVTSMSAMFQNCEKLTSLNLKKFNTSKVNYMNSMFNNCKGLTNLDLSNFNTSSVLNMDYMFSECYSLENIDLSTFDTSNVINMARMFYNCQKIKKLQLSFDTSKVYDFSYMFHNTGSANNNSEINFGFLYMKNLHNAYDMFLSCAGARGTILIGREIDNWEKSNSQYFQMFNGAANTFFSSDNHIDVFYAYGVSSEFVDRLISTKGGSSSNVVRRERCDPFIYNSYIRVVSGIGFNNTIYYSSQLTYSNGKYSLVNPKAYTSGSGNLDILGKFTSTTSSTTNIDYIYFITAIQNQVGGVFLKGIALTGRPETAGMCATNVVTGPDCDLSSSSSSGGPPVGTKIYYSDTVDLSYDSYGNRIFTLKDPKLFTIGDDSTTLVGKFSTFNTSITGRYINKILSLNEDGSISKLGTDYTGVCAN